MPDEVWLPVLGSPGYDVSDSGRVKGPRGVLKPSRLNSGYLGVKVGGKGTTVHAVVALAFIGQMPTPAHTVNHKNGDKHDNRPANLEWMTRKENMRHAVDTLGVKFGSKKRLPPPPPQPEPGTLLQTVQVIDASGRVALSVHLLVPPWAYLTGCALAMMSVFSWLCRVVPSQKATAAAVNPDNCPAM